MEGIYNRTANKFNALLSTQGQMDSQAQANVGTYLNKTMFDQKVALEKQMLASQERMAKEQAKAIQKAGQSASNKSLFGDIIGAAASFGSKFIGL